MYHVADDEPLTYYDFVKLTADALGVGPPRRIPAGFARVVAGRDPVAAVVRSARTSNDARCKRSWVGSRGSRAPARASGMRWTKLQAAPAASAIAR